MKTFIFTFNCSKTLSESILEDIFCLKAINKRNFYCNSKRQFFLAKLMTFKIENKSLQVSQFYRKIQYYNIKYYNSFQAICALQKK